MYASVVGTAGVKVMAQPPAFLRLEVLTAHTPVSTAPATANVTAAAAAATAVPAAAATATAVPAATGIAAATLGSNVVDKLG